MCWESPGVHVEGLEIRLMHGTEQPLEPFESGQGVRKGRSDRRGKPYGNSTTLRAIPWEHPLEPEIAAVAAMEEPQMTLGSYLHVSSLAAPAPIFQGAHSDYPRCSTSSTQVTNIAGAPLGCENHSIRLSPQNHAAQDSVQVCIT